MWPTRSFDVYAYDLQTGESARLTTLEKNWTLNLWSISADGTILSLDGSDEDSFSDVFVLDTVDGTVTSFAREFGILLDGEWHDRKVALSETGGLAAFSAGIGNLVPGDSNEVRDIFVIQLDDAPPELSGDGS